MSETLEVIAKVCSVEVACGACEKVHNHKAGDFPVNKQDGLFSPNATYGTQCECGVVIEFMLPQSRK
tara:strand:- start:829 stop:1029 length:201 start_codon:yes stop_codon:yes gene_type:complete